MENKKEVYPVSTLSMRYFRPTFAQLMSEANKYVALGNIVDAVKEYKENESPLDIQLREFKKLQNEKHTHITNK
jgi:pyruvate/2-oxoacid:ferredoxin oxidoreductase alpha subunit